MKIWVGKQQVDTNVIEWSGRGDHPIAALFICPACNKKQWYRSSELYIAKDQSNNNIKCKNCNMGKEFLRYQTKMLNFFKKTINKFKKKPKPEINDNKDFNRLHDEIQQLKDLIINMASKGGTVTNVTNIHNVAKDGSKIEQDDYVDSTPIFIPSTIMNKETKGEVDIASKESSADNLDEAAKALKKLKKRKTKRKSKPKPKPTVEHAPTCKRLKGRQADPKCQVCKNWI